MVSLGFLEAMGQRVDGWLSSMGLRTGRDITELAKINHAPPKREQIHVAPPFQPIIADRIRNASR